MTATRQIVLAGYRNLIRAARTTFRGDTHALKAARVELRTQFEDGRDCPGGDDEVQERVQAIHDAHDFLTHHVSQAVLTPEGNYAVDLEDPHVTEQIAVSDKHADFTVLQNDDVLPEKAGVATVNVISSEARLPNNKK